MLSAARRRRWICGNGCAAAGQDQDAKQHHDCMVYVEHKPFTFHNDDSHSVHPAAVEFCVPTQLSCFVGTQNRRFRQKVSIFLYSNCKARKISSLAAFRAGRIAANSARITPTIIAATMPANGKLYGISQPIALKAMIKP